MDADEAGAERATGWQKPAPGELRLLQQLLNSYDVEDSSEDLDTPEHLAAWLEGRGLLSDGVRLAEQDRERLLELRQGLMQLALANNGEPVSTEAIAALNRLAARAPLQIRLTPEGEAQLTPYDTGLDGAIGRFLAITYRAMADGSWSRFKVCRDDRCRWAYYDSSKNRSRTWCSMTTCGNRNKVRAYQRRRRGE